jgi:putative DNA primase/helicase
VTQTSPEVALLAGSVFPDERSRTPAPFEGTARDLVGGRHRLRDVKSGTPCFSPVVYSEGAQRGKRGVVHATALVLDFDHLSSEAAEDVYRRLAARGWGWLGYSSFSHQVGGADDVCFRLLILVSRPITPGEYDAVWESAVQALGGYADRNARDISRLWYVASCPAERAEHAWLRCAAGRPLDVPAAVAAHRRKQPKPAGAAQKADRPIASGQRNVALTSLAGAMRRQGADGPAILEALLATNQSRCRPPLPDADVRRVVASIERYDPESPLLLANPTDLGNAERFVAFAGDRFRFVPAWGTWLAFDGARWRRDTDGETVRTARDLLRATAAQAMALSNQEEAERLMAHALASESRARISSMLDLAQALLPVATDALDQDHDAFNCANGTLDLRTGALRPHHRDDLLTRLSPVRWEPDAACPRWEAFLDQITGGRKGVIAFLQRAIGYSLTGHVHEQVLLLLYGTGANGKSTFLETLRSMLGDYATQTDFTTFLKRDGDGARNDLARLVGARFVSAVEAEPGRPFAEAVVKQMTGGDTITARFLFKEFFDFKPVFKLWFAANHKPAVAGTDHGIWRRMRLVPFTVTIPEEERDPRLPEKLLAELPGILAWAVRGAMAWHADGLGVPAEVRTATASYRDEMDSLGPFVEETCLTLPDARVTAADLYAAYGAWCAANGERTRSQKGFASALREHGYVAVRGAKGVRCWQGLRIRTAFDHREPASDGASGRATPE